MKAYRLTLDATVETDFAKGTKRAGLQSYLLAVQSKGILLIGADADQAAKALRNVSSQILVGAFWESEVSWHFTEDRTKRLYTVTGPIAFEVHSKTVGPIADNIDGSVSGIMIGFRQHGDAPLILPKECTLIEGQISDSSLDMDFDEF